MKPMKNFGSRYAWSRHHRGSWYAGYGAFRPKAQDDPLPSWNNGSAKNAILEFAHATTDPSSSKFVPPTAMTMSGLYLLEEGAGQSIRKVRFLFPK